MPADHADDKATFGLVRACLQLKLASFKSCLLLLGVEVSLLEDGQKCLDKFNNGIAHRVQITHPVLQRTAPRLID